MNFEIEHGWEDLNNAASGYSTTERNHDFEVVGHTDEGEKGSFKQGCKSASLIIKCEILTSIVRLLGVFCNCSLDYDGEKVKPLPVPCLGVTIVKRRRHRNWDRKGQIFRVL